MNFIEYIPCNWRFFLPNKSMNSFGNLNISPEEVVAAVVIEVPDGQTHVAVPNSAVVFPETVESKAPYKTFFVVPFVFVVFLVMSSFPAVDFSVNWFKLAFVAKVLIITASLPIIRILWSSKFEHRKCQITS